MSLTPPRKWYQKKRYIIPAAIVGVVAVASSALGTSTSQSVPVVEQQPVVQSAVMQAPEQGAITSPQPSTAASDNLSNSNYYTNSTGAEVHSPAYNEDMAYPQVQQHSAVMTRTASVSTIVAHARIMEGWLSG